MPAVRLADGDLNYLLEGPAGAPVLVLSNSLGTDLHMWDAQVPAFTRHFRVLRYDTRGHGQSLVSEGPYRIEQLGRDVLALLDALDIPKAHFCGLSMGGLIGQWLAINAPERIQRLVLCNTAAKIGTPRCGTRASTPCWRAGPRPWPTCATPPFPAGSPRTSPRRSRRRSRPSSACWRAPRPRATPPAAPLCATPTSASSSLSSRRRPWWSAAAATRSPPRARPLHAGAHRRRRTRRVPGRPPVQRAGR